MRWFDMITDVLTILSIAIAVIAVFQNNQITKRQSPKAPRFRYPNHGVQLFPALFAVEIDASAVTKLRPKI